MILCGMDDSASAAGAARAAAAIAKLSGESLELIYVQDVLRAVPVAVESAEAAPGGLSWLETDLRRMREVLEPLRASLAREFGIGVSWRLEVGLADLGLARCAETLGASLIVVGALGRRTGSMWRLGSVPDRLSQSSGVPVLVVRDARCFVRWALEGQPLRLVLALGPAPSGARAFDVAAALRKLGPCQVVEAHAYDLRREAWRLGLSTDAAETPSTVERTLARELSERASAAELGDAICIARPSGGEPAEALVQIAEEQRADLLIAGARGRGAIERRFLGSVSFGLLGLAGTNVLIARDEPRAPSDAGAPRAPARVRRLLVATDLSPDGNRALDLGLGLLPHGGQLVLLHVLPAPRPASLTEFVPDALQPGPQQRRMNRSLALAELRSLLPSLEKAQEVEVEVVEAGTPEQGILQAAERHGADLVILGRHGQGRLAAALIGSVARAVVRHCPRPVLLVPL